MFPGTIGVWTIWKMLVKEHVFFVLAGDDGNDGEVGR